MRFATTPAFMSQAPRPNMTSPSTRGHERVTGPLGEVARRHDVGVPLERQHRHGVVAPGASCSAATTQDADRPPGLLTRRLHAGELRVGGQLWQVDLPVVHLAAERLEPVGHPPLRLTLGGGARDRRDRDQVGQHRRPRRRPQCLDGVQRRALGVRQPDDARAAPRRPPDPTLTRARAAASDTSARRRP